MIRRLPTRFAGDLVGAQGVIYLLAGVVAVLISRLPLPIAAALVGIGAVFILALINPLFGLGLALLLGPFGALEAIILGPSLLDSGQMALMLTFAAWIGTGLARRRLLIPRAGFNIPWLLFILIAALSLLDAYSVSLGLVELLKWLEIGFIVWLILDMASDPERRPSGYREYEHDTVERAPPLSFFFST